MDDNRTESDITASEASETAGAAVRQARARRVLLVGDDGGANQIGVAPGVNWIAANGCCPSDTALVESGQWMLEPTDSAGANPRVSLHADRSDDALPIAAEA